MSNDHIREVWQGVLINKCNGAWLGMRAFDDLDDMGAEFSITANGEHLSVRFSQFKFFELWASTDPTIKITLANIPDSHPLASEKAAELARSAMTAVLGAQVGGSVSGRSYPVFTLQPIDTDQVRAKFREALATIIDQN